MLGFTWFKNPKTFFWSRKLVLGFGYCLKVSWLFCVVCFIISVSLTASYTEDEPHFRVYSFLSFVLDTMSIKFCCFWTELEQKMTETQQKLDQEQVTLTIRSSFNRADQHSAKTSVLLLCPWASLSRAFCIYLFI